MNTNLSSCVKTNCMSLDDEIGDQGTNSQRYEIIEAENQSVAILSQVLGYFRPIQQWLVESLC